MNRIPLAVGTALLLLAGTVPAASAEDTRDREADRQWRDEPRSLELERTAAEFQFTSERATGLGTDRVEVRYDRDVGRLDYTFTAFDPEGDGVQIVQSAQFLALVEFHDPSGDGRYGFDAQVIERHPLSAMTPRAITSDAILQGRGYQAVAEYTIPDGRDHEDPLAPPPALTDGTLRLEFTMVDRPRNVGGDPLSPMEVRFRVQITDHPFMEDGTALALELAVEGNRPVALLESHNGTVQQAREYQTMLSWSPQVLADGQAVPVAVSTIALPTGTNDEDLRLMAAYPGADDLQHDWSIGTSRLSELPEEIAELLARGDLVVFGAAAIATIALAGLPVLKRLRGG